MLGAKPKKEKKLTVTQGGSDMQGDNEATSEDSRESWEREAYMDVIMPRIEKKFADGKLTATTAIHTALTQGIDEAMNREMSRLNNFALVAALFLTMTTAQIMEPPTFHKSDLFPDVDASVWENIYGGMQAASTMFLLISIVFTIHIQNMWTMYIHCDADYLRMLLQREWNHVTAVCSVTPLIIGIVLYFLSIALAADFIYGPWIYTVILPLGIATLMLLAPCSPVGEPAFRKLLDEEDGEIDERHMQSILSIYRARAATAAKSHNMYLTKGKLDSTDAIDDQFDSE
jgi:hypothetical protein